MSFSYRNYYLTDSNGLSGPNALELKSESEFLYSCDMNKCLLGLLILAICLLELYSYIATYFIVLNQYNSNDIVFHAYMRIAIHTNTHVYTHS